MKTTNTVKPLAFSKVSAMDQATISRAIAARPASKTDLKAIDSKAGKAENKAGKAETKTIAPLFALVAGTIRAIADKRLKGALSHHVSLGNLTKTGEGYKLTEQGIGKFNADRLTPNPALFASIASFMHANGPAPENCTRWGGQYPAFNLTPTIKFPNYIHWGSFASKEMRIAFASIWASKAGK